MTLDGGSILEIASMSFEVGFRPYSVMVCPKTWISLAKKVHFEGLRANFFVDRVKTEKCGTCLQNQLPSLFAQRYLMVSQ